MYPFYKGLTDATHSQTGLCLHCNTQHKKDRFSLNMPHSQNWFVSVVMLACAADDHKVHLYVEEVNEEKLQVNKHIN